MKPNPGNQHTPTPPPRNSNPPVARQQPENASVRRLAAQVPGEAAEMLGVSPDFFDRHIRPELRVVYRGRLRLVAVAELERWLDREARTSLDAA